MKSHTHIILLAEFEAKEALRMRAKSDIGPTRFNRGFSCLSSNL